MLTNKDVCIIMPTFNREKNVDNSLSFIAKEKPGKVIIVDQSVDEIKKIVKETVSKYKKEINIEYLYLPVPSMAIAQNIGVGKAKKNYKIILIIDDDIDLLPGYIKGMLEEYNSNPKAMAVGGVLPGINYNVKIKINLAKKIKNFIFKIFFLPHKKNYSSKITGPYGVSFPLIINKPIRDAQWIAGSNESFRSEVFDWYSFPKTLGYTLVEDLDSSYSIYKKYGYGSLVRTPKCKAIHHHSIIERDIDKKRIFINHEDHFYFFFRHFNNLRGKLKMVWSLFGIISGNLTRFLFRPDKNNWLYFSYNCQAIWYCYKNRENIKNQKFRSFLNQEALL